MSNRSTELSTLFSRIPRRHNADNIKEMYAILNEYEGILRELESEPAYETTVAPFFDELDSIRETIRNASLNKHSKPGKDKLFDEGSGALKESMEALMKVIA